MDYTGLMLEVLETVEDVIEALGGTAAMARLTGSRMTAVSNWRRQYNRFPARTYTHILAELEKVGKTAPASLWGMIDSPTEDGNGAPQQAAE